MERITTERMVNQFVLYMDQQHLSITQAIRTIEAVLVQKVMIRCGGNVAKSARFLGIGRTTLHEKRKALGLWKSRK